MYEDLGELDKAFEHLSEGNILRKRLLGYSIDRDKNLFEKLKKAQPDIIKNSFQVQKSSNGLIPIFIIGMPRSGTTIVEQIIASHSEVTGAGELEYVSQYGAPLATGVNTASKKAFTEFKEKYVSALLKISNGKRYVTDKMPQNFCFIPLICSAFPEAKIIHVQRSAAATCWSNYKQYFSSQNLGYCYDLNDILAYYKLYTDLMKTWQSQYGCRIFNLSYETLTVEQEKETKKLIDYLELGWERACLSPQKNMRSVGTASQKQVRREIYQESSQAWRKYEPFLDGAFDNLPS
jgi:hypothetical protein